MGGSDGGFTFAYFIDILAARRRRAMRVITLLQHMSIRPPISLTHRRMRREFLISPAVSYFARDVDDTRNSAQGHAERRMRAR